MKTHYRILWVDDDIESVRADIGNVKDFFEDYGIEADVIEFQSEPSGSIHGMIESELENPETDLIVVDFNMKGMDGDTLINAIRETNHIFLPVVFYSQDGPERLHEQAAEQLLEGVYISGRDNVQSKIEDVAKSLLNKEETIKRTRGLLMEGVSEIDANFKCIFVSLWDQLDGAQQGKLVRYFKEKLSDKLEDTVQLINSLPDNPAEFHTAMQSDFVSSKYDTITRWKILKKMFKLLGIEGDEVDIFHRLFVPQDNQRPLITIRNAYAHKTREQLKADHDRDVCIAIRQEMRSQMQNTCKDIPEMLNEN